MQTANINITGNIGGINFSANITSQGEGGTPQEVDLPAALAGQLTTRTDNDTGVITVAHTFQINDLVDVYWDGGLRSRMKVTNAGSGTTMTVDLGAGDNLPTNLTAVSIGAVISIVIDLPHDSLIIIGAEGSGDVYFDVLQTGGTTALADAGGVALDAGQFWTWNSGQGATTNPLSANAVEIQVSTSDTSGCVFQFSSLYDSTSQAVSA